jgi:hypothetical protein
LPSPHEREPARPAARSRSGRGPLVSPRAADGCIAQERDDPRAGPRDADVTGRATASVGHRTAASRGETNGRTAPIRPCPGTIASITAAASCRLCLCHGRDRVPELVVMAHMRPARLGGMAVTPPHGLTTDSPRASEQLSSPRGNRVPKRVPKQANLPSRALTQFQEIPANRDIITHRRRLITRRSRV